MKVNGTDLYIVRGDTEKIIVSCSDINKQPIFLQTGDKIYFTVKQKVTDIDKILQKLITVFIDGKAIVNLESADTANLKFKTYVYDIQWTKADNSVTTLIPASKFVVTEEVTYE